MTDERNIRVHDPVCDKELDLGEVVAMLDHRDWAYFFCSTACRDAFRADPDRFAGDARGDRAPRDAHPSQQS